MDEIVRRLRSLGARFAYVFGSRVRAEEREGSDVDVAAWFGQAVDPFKASAGLPGNVDLVVLDTAPLAIAGRVAMEGKVLFCDDDSARVRWEAATRKVWLDERPRVEQATRDFLAGVRTRARGRS